MEIVIYPDPVLRRPTESVEPGPEIAKTAREMLATMYESKGVGLAAPQVGISKRLLVLNPSGDPAQPAEELVLLNPKIVERKGKEWGQEGCLSFPGITAEIQRAQRIRLKATDPEGAGIDLVAEDFLARVIQHELDHLEGVLFVDRFSPADQIRNKKELASLAERAQGKG